MDRAYYFQSLYPLQDQALALIDRLDTRLYLTGGTAASRGYLHHRFSDDLDLFANDSPEFGLWSERVVVTLTERKDWRIDVIQREQRFVRLNLVHSTATLKIEIVNDVPAHVGEVRHHDVLGRLDSPENILANKISAAVDREEPKDLADIWGFACQLGLPIAEALAGAQGKAAGIFPADLARILCTATRKDWELVRWIEPPPAEQFLADLQALGEQLILT